MIKPFENSLHATCEVVNFFHHTLYAGLMLKQLTGGLIWLRLSYAICLLEKNRHKIF
jgi:hypothetical protein